jgi:hypothetical protein
MAHWPWNTDPTLNTVSKQLADLTALVKANHFKEVLAMSVLSDKIAAVGVALDKALARVDEDVLALVAKIAELQALIDAGGATPEDIAALDALQAKLDALDPTKPAVLPE